MTAIRPTSSFRRRGTFLGTLGLVFCVLTGGVATADGRLAEVTIADDGLTPPRVRLALGDSVSWINQSHTPRAVKESHLGLFDSGLLLPLSGTFAHQFSLAGTFGYVVELAPVSPGLDTEFHGVVGVPPTVTAAPAGGDDGWKSGFTWALGTPEGLAFDVQVLMARPRKQSSGEEHHAKVSSSSSGEARSRKNRRHGKHHGRRHNVRLRMWLRSSNATSGLLPMKCDGRRYAIRVRVVDTASRAYSAWSPFSAPVSCLEEEPAPAENEIILEEPSVDPDHHP